MAQRTNLAPLRIAVPTLGISQSLRLSKYHIAFSPAPTPSPVIYQAPHTGRLWIAVLLQLSSLYAAHQWLIRSQSQSVIKFAFLAFFGTSVVLGFLQRPWKGRSISPSQGFMLLISGGILALSFVLRMRGLAEVGPLETILAEYAGAVVGKVLIKAQRKVHGIGDAKVRGALGLLAGLFLLSQGWAVSSCSPLSSIFVPASKTSKFASARLTRSTRIGYTSESRAFIGGEDIISQPQKDCAKYVHIIFPILAGLLSTVQKLLPSRTSLMSVPKKRLQALTYVAAGAVFIPIAFFQLAFWEGVGFLDRTVVWPLFSMIAFGMVLAFYGEFFSEEKLLISSLSPFHFFVTICSVCLLELTYGSNFSLLGFVVCSLFLGIGVRAGGFISGGLDWNSMSEKQYSGPSLFSMVKTPLYHIWTDVKTRKIAMFLLLNTSFMVVEFVYGFLSNSLGLISDACHMLFDCAALAIGLYASYISRLPPNSKFNFGYGRFEVLSGYANAVFLILVAALIVLESLERLLEPPEISTESLLVVSVGGLLVNVVGLIFFHEAHHHAHGSAPCTHAHHDEIGPYRKTQGKQGQVGVSLTHVHPSSVSAVVHSHGNAQLHQGQLGQLDSPILHIQEFPPKVKSISIESQGRGAKLDQHISHSANGASLSVVQQSELLDREDGFVRQQVPKEQPLLEHSFSLSGLHRGADEHRHLEEGSSPIHVHKHDDSRTASRIASQGHHDHSGHSSPDQDYYVARNLSPGPQHSQLHPEHQHSVSCLDNQDHQHGQYNPFVQQSHSNDKHQHSETCSHKHSHHAGHGSHGQPFLQHSHSHSDHQQFGVHRAYDHEHGRSISNISTESRSGNNGISTATRNYNDGHRDQHHHDEEKKRVSGSSQKDHLDGHSHKYNFQACSEDHENHGDDHGPCQSHEADHHHQLEGHHHSHDHSHSPEGHHHHGHKEHHSYDQQQDHKERYHGDSPERDHHHGHKEHHSHDDQHEHKGHHHSHDHSHSPEGDHHHDHEHDHNGHPHSHDHQHDHKGHHHNHDHQHDHKGHHHSHDHNHNDEGNHDEHGDHHHIDHNMEGIFLHILADTLGSVGVVISTLLIKYKGWLFTDPACSIFISVLIISSVLPLVRNSAELLLQRVPRSAEKRIQKALKKVEDVEGVHDWHKMHVWSYTNTDLVGTLRLHASIGSDKQLVRKKVSRILQEAGIVDLTLEVEDLEHADDQ